jgi:hypothetical protein
MKEIKDFSIPQPTSSGIFPFEDLRLFPVQVEEVVVVVVLQLAVAVEEGVVARLWGAAVGAEVVVLQSVMVEQVVELKSYSYLLMKLFVE